MNWYLKVLRQYADFDGRARRTEYWMFTLVNFIISMVLYLPALYLTIDSQSENPAFFIVYGLYSLALFIPSLAVSVRRLHDVGKSAWFFLILFIPFIGAIWILVLYFMDSDAGSNEYGPNPKTNEFEYDDILDSNLI